MTPQIVAPDFGRHNADLDATITRLTEAAQWRRLDTVMIIPAGGMVPTKAALSWMNLYSAPNNGFCRIPTVGAIECEVGEAYNATIQMILDHPQLSKYKYILTVEHDNVVPADGLVKLQQRMENHPEFDCIGGLYYTKGEGGVPQIWGDPRDPMTNYRPQIPVPGQLVECCGTGMGFNLWRTEMFRDKDLRKPWFKTQTEGGVATQDLYFWSDARRHGYRCAVDCSILVGHYDAASDMTW